jgi:hypothetical protein
MHCAEARYRGMRCADAHTQIRECTARERIAKRGAHAA